MLNTGLSVDDTVVLVLPMFTLGTLGSITTHGCGTTTFIVAKANSGTSTAALTLTAKTTVMTANTKCVATLGSGVSAPAVAQAAVESGVASRPYSTLEDYRKSLVDGLFEGSLRSNT